jgi:hypothetical protein
MTDPLAALIPVLSGLLAYFGAFAAAYMSKKAENIATREDIEEITRMIESVKADLAPKAELRRLVAARKIEVMAELIEKADALSRMSFQYGTTEYVTGLQTLGQLIERNEYLFSSRLVVDFKRYLGAVIGHGVTLTAQATPENIMDLVGRFTEARNKLITLARTELHVESDLEV